MNKEVKTLKSEYKKTELEFINVLEPSLHESSEFQASAKTISSSKSNQQNYLAQLIQLELQRIEQKLAIKETEFSENLETNLFLRLDVIAKIIKENKFDILTTNISQPPKNILELTNKVKEFEILFEEFEDEDQLESFSSFNESQNNESY